MRKYLKVTVAILLATALLTGNTGSAQSKQADVIRKSSIEKVTFTVKAAEIQQNKVNVKAESKKSTTKAYNKKARKAYKKFLKEYYVQGKSFFYDGTEYKWSDDNSSKYSDRKYTIYDINHDGKKELLIYNTGRPEYYLFTYYKGKVKCASVAGYHDTFLECKKRKVIIMSGSNCGSESNHMYILQKGTLKDLGGVFIENKYTGSGIMKNGKIINRWSFSDGTGKKISRAQFKKILKKYTGSTNIKAFCVCYMQHKKVKTQLEEIKYKTYKY